VVAIHLGPALPRASCCLPGSWNAAGHRSSPIRHRSGWGLPSRPVTWPLVVSYTTVSA